MMADLNLPISSSDSADVANDRPDGQLCWVDAKIFLTQGLGTICDFVTPGWDLTEEAVRVRSESQIVRSVSVESNFRLSATFDHCGETRLGAYIRNQG